MAEQVPDYSVAKLQDDLRQARSIRRPYERDWFMNLAYIEGQQWSYWNGGWIDLARSTDRELVVDNRMRPVVEQRVARKAKNRPTFVATPNTGDDADVQAAQIGEKSLTVDWTELQMQRKLYEVLLWTESACDGFWKIFWDSTKGKKEQFLFNGDQPIMNPEDNTPLRASEAELLPSELLGQAQVREIAAGDVVIEVISPFEFFPDPLATSMDDLEWVIEEKVRSLEYVRRRYPTNAAGEPFEPKADANAPGSIMQGRMFSTPYADTAEGYEAVKVYEYWCKPNTEHPAGHRAVWVNDTKLVDEVPFDPMPYVRFSSTQVAGQFWSRAVASDLRKPQEDLNKMRTQILENAKRLGNPAVLASRQANIEMEGIPGERIDYDSTVPDAVPSYLEPPSIPVYVENEVERILRSIEEVSGVHEVSRATVPPGVTAAAAINLLQEADDTRIGPEIQAMEQSIEEAGVKILKHRATFNTDERTMRLAGEDGDWDIFAFKGAMLGDDPQIRVEAGSGMPRSKAAKQELMIQMIEQAMQYGLPIPERNLRKFFRDFDVGGLDRLFENISNDEGQCVREHRDILTGKQLQINDFDDDAFHIQAHTDFQKSSRYAGLPEEIKQLFTAHVILHRQRMVQTTNLQLQQQGGEQGATVEEEHAMKLDEIQAKNEGKLADTALKVSAERNGDNASQSQKRTSGSDSNS